MSTKHSTALEVAPYVGIANPHGCTILVEDIRQALAVVQSSLDEYHESALRANKSTADYDVGDYRYFTRSDKTGIRDESIAAVKQIAALCDAVMKGVNES